MILTRFLYNAHKEPYAPFVHFHIQSPVANLGETVFWLRRESGYDYDQKLSPYHNDYTLPSQFPFLHYNNYWVSELDPNSFVFYHKVNNESRTIYNNESKYL